MDASSQPSSVCNALEEFFHTEFRVIIVGGGITGLTLANCLQQEGVDYVLLEARNDIAPQIGASVCLGPSALRIMDQLGLCDQIMEECEPVHTQYHWMGGKCSASDDFYLLSKARWGYDVCCLDRQILLRILYDGITDKTKIQTGKKVVTVDHKADRAMVHCENGSAFYGDVVVGADGVHSRVRKEMWRSANMSGSGFEPSIINYEETNRIKADYNCLFGISKNITSVKPGTFHRVYAEGSSGLLAAGKDGKIHWFFFTKLDRTYRVPAIPRYTDVNTQEHAARFRDWRYTDEITLADLWEKRTSCTLACIEEFLLHHWAWGRYICIGDSVHKATPNAGLGGSQAIESCAALTNNLLRLMRHKYPESKMDTADPDMKVPMTMLPRRPTFEDIEASLLSVQKKRWARVESAITQSNGLTRLEALEGFKEKLIMLFTVFILSISSDFITNRISYGTIGAEKLESRQDPQRSYSGFAHFNPNYGIGKEQSKIKRAKFAFPLLLLGYLYFHLSSAIQLGSGFKSQYPSRDDHLVFAGSPRIPFCESYCDSYTSCNRFLKIFVSTFCSSIIRIDQISPAFYQAFSFITDAMPLFMIWVFESYRRSNALTFVRFLIIFTILAQLYGLGAISPVYYFLHYVQSPLGQFISKDMRMINIASTRAAIPAIMIAYGMAYFLQDFIPSALWLQANAVWQPHPVVFIVVHWTFATVLVKDTTQVARRTNPSADMKYIRIAMLFCSLAAAIGFNYVRFASGYSFLELYVPASAFLADPYGYISTADSLDCWRLFLQLDEIVGFFATFAWLGLLFWDLKEAEMLHWSWFGLIVTTFMITSVAGPGCAIGMLWIWREETLARSTMKGAVLGSQSRGLPVEF